VSISKTQYNISELIPVGSLLGQGGAMSDVENANPCQCISSTAVKLSVVFKINMGSALPLPPKSFVEGTNIFPDPGPSPSGYGPSPPPPMRGERAELGYAHHANPSASSPALQQDGKHRKSKVANILSAVTPTHRKVEGPSVSSGKRICSTLPKPSAMFNINPYGLKDLRVL
jgi:hypothetical protein